MPTFRTIDYGGPSGTYGHITALRVSPTRLKGNPVVTPNMPRVGIEQNRARYQGSRPQITGDASTVYNTGYLYSSGSPAVARAYAQNLARTHGLTGTYTGPASKTHGKIKSLGPHPYYPKGGFRRTSTKTSSSGAAAVNVTSGGVDTGGVNLGGVNLGGIDLGGLNLGGINFGKVAEIAAIAIGAILLLILITNLVGRRR